MEPIFYSLDELKIYKKPNPNSKRGLLDPEKLNKIQCYFCQVTESPEFRSGAGNSKLCNSCGLRFKKLRYLGDDISKLMTHDKSADSEKTFQVYMAIAEKLQRIIHQQGGYDSSVGSAIARRYPQILNFCKVSYNDD